MIGIIELFILIGSFLTTFLLVPKIIGISRYKQLMDEPNSRSSHKHLTPNLGGVAFFVSLMLSSYFFQLHDTLSLSYTLIPCLTILFIVGLKDDLVIVSTKTKFVAQFIVSGFLIFDNTLEITNFHGFLHLNELPQLVGILLVPVIVTGVINAINLIDGIDGLASSIGLIALSGFGFLFYRVDMQFPLMLCIAMAGCLIGFLPHNLNRKDKIFMGDTGSMILGFVIAFLAVTALAIPEEKVGMLPVQLANIPVLLVFLIFVPLMDTLRIMTVRMIKGKSPFKPDRTHFHHYFLFRKGFTHRQTTARLILIALIFVFVGFILANSLPYWANLAILLFIYLSSVFISISLTSRNALKKGTTFLGSLTGALRSIF
jgi:UDP-GlcNAc:undecaprenyl-phosphate GlcNAc-1-phosphate transferase